MASALTWLATHAAACCRAAAAAASAGWPAACPPGPPPPDSATVAAPAAKATATSAATSASRHRRACPGHKRPSRRCDHKLTVVTSTEPHDGSAAGGLPAGSGVSARPGGDACCLDSSGCWGAASPAARRGDRGGIAHRVGLARLCRPQSVPGDLASGHRTPCPSHSPQRGESKRPAPVRPSPRQTGQPTFA